MVMLTFLLAKCKYIEVYININGRLQQKMFSIRGCPQIVHNSADWQKRKKDAGGEHQ